MRNFERYGFSFDEFINYQGKKYLYGINEYSIKLSEKISVDGYIDDYSDVNYFSGKPVLKLADIPPGPCLVVSCVVSARPLTALKNLERKKNIRYMDYPALCECSSGELSNILAVHEARSDYSYNKSKYIWIRSLLVDDVSVNTFDDLLRFRLTADVFSLLKYDFRVHEQYFPSFLECSENDVFVDGGAFDGLTSIQFSKMAKSYRAIHVFEPDPVNLHSARMNMINMENVFFHAFGLYDKKTSLAFDASAGSASKISSYGDAVIDVIELDEGVKDPVSFIKLDIEGAELHALHGMKKHILNDHPKLAVAVYHSPDHFWKVPEFVLGLRSDYRVYLRHYTESWTETVMYFIPC